jgi:hypothetical protein
MARAQEQFAESVMRRIGSLRESGAVIKATTARTESRSAILDRVESERSRRDTECCRYPMHDG